MFILNVVDSIKNKLSFFDHHRSACKVVLFLGAFTLVFVLRLNSVFATGHGGNLTDLQLDWNPRHLTNYFNQEMIPRAQRNQDDEDLNRVEIVDTTVWSPQRRPVENGQVLILGLKLNVRSSKFFSNGAVLRRGLYTARCGATQNFDRGAPAHTGTLNVQDCRITLRIPGSPSVGISATDMEITGEPKQYLMSLLGFPTQISIPSLSNHADPVDGTSTRPRVPAVAAPVVPPAPPVVAPHQPSNGEGTTLGGAMNGEMGFGAE